MITATKFSLYFEEHNSMVFIVDFNETDKLHRFFYHLN